MPTTRLKIDTSVATIAGPASVRNAVRNRSITPGSAHLKQPYPLTQRRLRRVSSSASSSSSLSIVSPNSSSTNNSPTSPHFHNEQTSSISSFHPSSYSPESPVSPLLDETLRLTSEYVLAMHDFSPQQQSATCLSFRAGQVIHVLNRDPSGWWDGELEGRRGWFPSNYVNADADVTSLIEEELPRSPRRRRGHGHSMSAASATSWVSSSEEEKGYMPTDRRTSETIGPDIETYCPPLMIPLLHALSLLQGAVRSNRVTQFQPSTACMISCVRSILSATDCLPREAPLLQKFALLAQERKLILSVLASLVAQAKKASEDLKYIEPDRRDSEVDAMLRLGGQVFAHVRRFLAVAVQCGVELPQRRRDSTSGLSSTDPEEFSSTSPTAISPTGLQRSPVMIHTAHTNKPSPFRDIGATGRPMAASRAKSMFDLRQRRKLDMEEPLTTVSHRTVAATVKQRILHRPATPSFGSSDSSSVSSTDSASPPSTPPFPSGSATTAQVMEALRHTHDQYLSTIAAFIGHAHSHSRTSHASSTGHMYDLVREVVDVVCKLLTIVDAVMRHPGVPAQKVGNLKAAKEGLYSVTNSLAESVRLLTVSLPSSKTEEEEKAGLLRSATGALKAGTDCMAAVKMCLTRSTGERSFIIQLPASELSTSDNFAAWKDSHPTDASLPDSLGPPEEDDIGPQPPSPVHTLRAQDPYASTSRDRPVPRRSEEVSPTSTETPQPPIALKLGMDEENHLATDLLSPTDDGTSWEGGIRGLSQIPGTPIEEKVLNTVLPIAPLEPVPETRPEPITWMLSHNYSVSDVAYNSDGVLVGASMEALVEKMTPHDSIVDAAFASVFFLTFRLFSSPSELLETIQARFNLSPPQNISPDDQKIWEQRKGLPVRLRVSNFIKSWLEMYWRSAVDNVILDSLSNFTRECIAATCAAPAQRIMELIQSRLSSTESTISPRSERLRDPLNPANVSLSETPRPTMTRTLLSSLRNKNFASISVTDFDALELARQLTIMECNLYSVIQPEEILQSGQEGVKPPVNVRALSTLSTTITGWVAESILNEMDLKKRQGLIKFFIKLADRCTGLNNFSTPRSILAALDSSTISRLRQTWGGVPQKNKMQLEVLRKLADRCRNYHEYRSRLRNTTPPAVPFLGLYLTDVIFCREGNPNHRPSPLAPTKKLINFNKYQKLARIVQDMQRFQYPYNLKEIPEVQEYLNIAFESARHHGDLQDLYRRSLLVEPRQAADNPPTSDMRQLFNWATRSQPQAAAS